MCDKITLMRPKLVMEVNIVALEIINCPECKGSKVSKNGKNAKGEQRYICKDDSCEEKSFKIDYIYNAWKADNSEKVLKARREGASIREISSQLEISKQKVQEILNNLQHLTDCLCKGCQD